MKLDHRGALMPIEGFSRWRPSAPLLAGQSAYRSHDGLVVVSSSELAHLPGSGTPPQVGPQWLVSVSRFGRRHCSPDDAVRAAVAFAMPAWDEDNHHPGVARHLWCPVDARYRQACECKLTEVTIIDGDYRWTNDTDTACRGCEYARLFRGHPCPLHPTSVGR